MAQSLVKISKIYKNEKLNDILQASRKRAKHLWQPTSFMPAGLCSMETRRHHLEQASSVVNLPHVHNKLFRLIQRWLDLCAINIMYFFFSQVASYCFDNCKAFAFLAVVCCFWINDADTLGSLITNKTVVRVEFDTQLRSFSVFALITGTPIESCSRQCWWRWPWVTEVSKRSRWVECFETMLLQSVWLMCTVVVTGWSSARSSRSSG